jgi:hypothetical protein
VLELHHGVSFSLYKCCKDVAAPIRDALKMTLREQIEAQIRISWIAEPEMLTKAPARRPGLWGSWVQAIWRPSRLEVPFLNGRRIASDRNYQTSSISPLDPGAMSPSGISKISPLIKSG